MVGKCIEISGNEAKFLTDTRKIEEGKSYRLEGYDEGTLAQNNTFHALISCFYEWMLSINQYQFEIDGIAYDFRCPDEAHLKKMFKFRYGAGAKAYVYVTSKFQMKSVKTIDEIPAEVLEDFMNGNDLRAEPILVSWSKYTKKQRTSLINTLKNIMTIVGVDSEKFTEIIEGMKSAQA